MSRDSRDPVRERAQELFDRTGIRSLGDRFANELVDLVDHEKVLAGAPLNDAGQLRRRGQQYDDHRDRLQRTREAVAESAVDCLEVLIAEDGR